MNDLVPTPEQPGDDDLVVISATSIDKSPALAYLVGLSKSGRRTQQQVLRKVAELVGSTQDIFTFPWQDLKYPHVLAIREQLLEAGASAATVNKCLAAVKGVLREAWRMGRLEAADYQLVKEVKVVKSEKLLAGRALTAAELNALLRTCEADDSPAGARDAALIAVMYAAGLRREEVVNLDLADYTPDQGQLVVRGGKRRKDRATYLLNEASRALADWLAIRGTWPGPLFVPVLKGGKVTDRRMTPQAIYNLLASRAIEAEVAKFSPHDLRRSFVSDLLDAGADITTVAKLAGHKSVNTTARYDRRPEEAKRKASQLLHVPYRGRG